ncbi:MAG: hypothetical protein AAGC72_05160 [Planctomycetota bacterium]
MAFNGRNGGRSAVDDLARETFYVPRQMEAEAHRTVDEHGRVFEFCKTGRKPYDLLVTAALIALKHHIPYVRVLSDGDAAEWEEGIALTRRVLNYGELPFGGRQRG